MNKYPISNKASTVPSSGMAVHKHLLENIDVVARLPHDLWYNGEKKKIDDPNNPFMGFFPIGRTLKLSYAGSPIQNYKFTGKETNAVLVKDLSPEAMTELGLSENLMVNKLTAKVFNPNYVSFDDLSNAVKQSNKNPTLMLAKSIDSFLTIVHGSTYSEQNVVDFLLAAIINANSQEMLYLLYNNYIAWCVSRFNESGVMEADVKRRYHSQEDPEFYLKDIGTIMPSILYTLAILGINPVPIIPKLTYDIWDIDNVANAIHDKFFKGEE